MATFLPKLIKLFEGMFECTSVVENVYCDHPPWDFLKEKYFLSHYGGFFCPFTADVFVPLRRMFFYLHGGCFFPITTDVFVPLRRNFLSLYASLERPALKALHPLADKRDRNKKYMVHVI